MPVFDGCFCVVRDEDCKGIAFWRRPLTRGPKVQGEEYANLSGKRTERNDSSLLWEYFSFTFLLVYD